MAKHKVGLTHTIEDDLGYLGLNVQFEPWVPVATVMLVLFELGTKEFGKDTFTIHVNPDEYLFHVNAI